MRKTIGVVVFLISVAVAGFAQVDTGSVVGTVKDASGAILPGVTVTATGQRHCNCEKNGAQRRLRDYSAPYRPILCFRRSHRLPSGNSQGHRARCAADHPAGLQSQGRLGFGNDGNKRSRSAARNRKRIPGQRCDRRNG